MIDVGVADAGDNLSYLRVGKVVAAEKHPNADKLQLCQVDVGEGEPRQIVCGAWNFGVGATVAVGLPGVLLPGFPAPLDERPLRGELSRGMILAEDEIGLGTDHAGIMLLARRDRAGNAARGRPAGARAGARRDADDEPRRPALDGRARPRGRDAVRRRAAAGRGRRPGDRASRSGSTSRSTTPEACPRYIARVFKDVTVGPSPMWLRARLHAAGMRSISNVVDVTNYVMHVYGSPLHAFDRAEARRRPDRRPARARGRGADARSTARSRTLDERDLLITDGTKAVALAAIMGGADSEVTDGDDRGAARGGELRADRDPADVGAARPADRGLEPLGEGRRPVICAEPAAVLASRLLVDLAGAELTGSADVHSGLPERPVVRLRPERTDRIVGLEVAPTSSARSSSGSASRSPTDWDVTVPTWRARDVTREIDVVEEVARVVLDRVPTTMPLRRAVAGHLTEEQRLRRLRRGRPRRRRLQRGVHVEPRREPIPIRTRSGCPTR